MNLNMDCVEKKMKLLPFWSTGSFVLHTTACRIFSSLLSIEGIQIPTNVTWKIAQCSRILKSQLSEMNYLRSEA